jgi:LPPG:FO 2-phospho-L-lactate transferase
LVAVLAGGTGGAKLARGMLDVVGAPELSVVVNTADDLEVHGVHVSPDPDLVTYRLADVIDEERGYGVRGDTWEVMGAIERAGAPAWFRLGDRDLATCLLRTARLRSGETLTDATQAVAHALGVGAAVLPMSDDPVRTTIESAGRRVPFQEFMVRDRHMGRVDGVELEGIEAARPTAAVLEAIASAEAIVIGPSNPVISIGPILATPGIRRAVADSPAPVVAVSPFVGGAVVKGPTAAFCSWAGLPLDVRALPAAYGDLLDGVVADEPMPGAGIASVELDTLMDSPPRRRAVAAAALELARSG